MLNRMPVSGETNSSTAVGSPSAGPCQTLLPKVAISIFERSFGARMHGCASLKIKSPGPGKARGFALREGRWEGTHRTGMLSVLIRS